MRTPAQPRADGERGSVMLALVLFTGACGLVATMLIERLVRPATDTVGAAEAALADVTVTARRAFRSAGAFPSNLTNLAAQSGRQSDMLWRQDPWASGLDLDYRIRQRELHLRSRGPDRRLGTADDLLCVVDDEPVVRLRQRARLRILRAVLAASSLRVAWTMSAADKQAMQAAMGDYAAARRSWLTADTAARTALTTRMQDAAAAIEAMRAAHGLPAMPTRLTGGSGLLTALGLPSGRAVDGLRRALDIDPVLGFVARGSDRTRGTDDDM